MLAQFQSLYPNGSIISELLQIFQGKYIVRVSVQIEGITRATGLAAAESVEAAEDNARNRALMVLGMTNVTAPATTTITSKPTAPVLSHTDGLPESTYVSSQEQWASSREVKPEPVTTEIHNPSKSSTSYPDFSQHLSVTSYQEPQFDLPPEEELKEQPLTAVSTSNVTPFTPRSHTAPEEVKIPTEKTRKTKKSEPVDLSDIIAQTDVHIERLGWTPEQGKEYLIKTYNKRGRTLLNEEELRDFLRYLQAQPDPIAGF